MQVTMLNSPGARKSALGPNAGAVRITAPYLNWETRKREVLQEFTVTGKISVAASFLADEDNTEIDTANLSVEKAKARLSILDAAARGIASVELSQADYERRIQKLQRDLTRAWNGNQRVTSLKIAIQCSKLLAEPRVPQFYPSMFVLVADILDTFGRLVFDRLKALAEEEHMRMGSTGHLSDDFSARDVGAEARETARNWFFKTSCIRELLPRLYVELSLLECYRFVSDSTDYFSTLMRLAHSIRGVGNPLVSLYLRWYLARQAGRLIRDTGNARDALQQSLSDYMFTFGECIPIPREAVASGSAQKDSAAPATAPLTIRQAALATQIQAAGLTVQQYLRLHAPAVAWMCHQVGWGAPRESFQTLLQQYREWCGCGMMLRCLMDGFDPAFYTPHLTAMMGLVAEAAGRPSDAATPQASAADLYTSLAGALAKHPPPPEKRIPFLNDCWRAVTRVTDPAVFSRHAANLMPLLLSAYSEREVLLLLGDLTKRLQAAASAGQGAAGSSASGSYRPGGSALAPLKALPHLERLLTALVEAEVLRVTVSSEEEDGGDGGEERPSSLSAKPAPSFSGIITSEWFGRLLDMFASDAKPALCNRLLSALVSVPGKVTDPVVVNTMFEVARTVHDSCDVLSSPEDATRTADTLSAFVDKVNFGKDLERQLAFYTDCRQAFGGLDSVKERLVIAVVRLADVALGYANGRHTSRTSQFARAVFAAAATSIPAIEDPFSRMTLYTHAAGSALTNGCISQADALLRSAITEIPELPTNVTTAAALTAGGRLAGGEVRGAGVDARLCGLLKDFARVAVTMPGHPDLGPFYLARGVLNALAKYPWSPSPSVSSWRVRCNVTVIPLLATLGRDPIPVPKVPGVDGNDVLYGGDPSYASDLAALLAQVLALVVAQLGEGAKAASSGEPGARGVVMDGVSSLCNGPQCLEALLEYDPHLAAPHLEAALNLLRGIAPEHPVLKSAIPVISAKIKARAPAQTA